MVVKWRQTYMAPSYWAPDRCYGLTETVAGPLVWGECSGVEAIVHGGLLFGEGTRPRTEHWHLLKLHRHEHSYPRTDMPGQTQRLLHVSVQPSAGGLLHAIVCRCVRAFQCVCFCLCTYVCLHWCPLFWCACVFMCVRFQDYLSPPSLKEGSARLSSPADAKYIKK